MTNAERATKAASARWSKSRQRGVRIYVDEDAAALLPPRPSDKRRVASEAIRRAANHAR